MSGFIWDSDCEVIRFVELIFIRLPINSHTQLSKISGTSHRNMERVCDTNNYLLKTNTIVEPGPRPVPTLPSVWVQYEVYTQPQQCFKSVTRVNPNKIIHRNVNNTKNKKNMRNR